MNQLSRQTYVFFYKFVADEISWFSEPSALGILNRNSQNVLLKNDELASVQSVYAYTDDVVGLVNLLMQAQFCLI